MGIEAQRQAAFEAPMEAGRQLQEERGLAKDAAEKAALIEGLRKSKPKPKAKAKAKPKAKRKHKTC